MSTRPRKPKSPPTPSRPLGDCVEDVRKLYDVYTRGKFQKAEIASKFNVSATAGPFQARLFTLKEFGLLDQSGSDYSVSDRFLTLRSGDSTDAKFKKAALDSIRKSGVFRQLLDEFKTKLPSIDDVATRLENQKGFNPARARIAATVLEKSLRYAGVLDGSNNILPIRDTPTAEGDQPDGQEHDADRGPIDEKLPQNMLGMEIPVADGRKVMIRYPQDLSAEEAKKVGAVLAAIVA